MEPEIHMLPQREALCVTRTGMSNGSFSGVAHEAFTALTGYIAANGLWDSMAECIGICPDNPAITPAEECRYQAGFILRGDVPTGEEVELVTIEAGRWAVFIHEGSYDTLSGTWSSIYRNWLPTSGMALRDVPPYEVYFNTVATSTSEDFRTAIHIPVA